METPQNPGSDKRTRLAIYGTGLRFADSVTVAGRDVAGNLWNLPVEYAGPAPGFFGFDQVNVVLPPEASAAGLMSLTASTDSALSNAVELEIRYSAAPSDVSVFPRSAPPGAEIIIQGAGFVPEAASLASPRTVVIFKTATGYEIPTAPLEAAADRLVALVPLIPGDLVPEPALDAWYQGPAEICVDVDGWQTCSPKPFPIETAVNPGRPTGETLLAIGQRRLEETVEFLRSSDPEAAQAVQADGQARLDELRAMIDAAREGSTFLVRNSSGETRFIELNLRLLDQFESLIAANGAGFAANAAPKASLSPETQRRFIDPSICGLPEELELARLKDARDGVTAGLKLFTELAALVAAVIEAPYLVPASIFIECDEDLNACTSLLDDYFQRTADTYQTLGTVAAYGDYSLFLKQFWIDFDTNSLESLRVDPKLRIDLEVKEMKPFRVYGRFVATRGAADMFEIFKEEALDQLASLLQEESKKDREKNKALSKFLRIPGLPKELSRAAIEKVRDHSIEYASKKTTEGLSEILDLNFTSFKPGQNAREILLSRASVDIDPIGRLGVLTLSQHPEALGTLDCNGEGQVMGKSSTRGNTYWYQLQSKTGLLLANGRLRAVLRGQSRRRARTQSHLDAAAAAIRGGGPNYSRPVGGCRWNQSQQL